MILDDYMKIMKNMKIYIDTCCYCRPFDNKIHMAQEDVRWESSAILDAVRLCRTAGFIIVGSTAITAEMANIKNDRKRELACGFYDESVTEKLIMAEAIINRAQELSAFGIKAPDSYHVAFAETAGANFLLTTDKRLEHSAERAGVKVKVINPTTFIEEFIKWLQTSM
jgi:predicted nucleic acid-binding protein